MALRNAQESTADASASATPAFEEMPGADTAVADATVTSETPRVSIGAQPAETAVALVVPPDMPAPLTKTNIAVRGLLAGTAMSGFKDRLGQTELESMGFGVFPRITIDNGGGFAVNKNEIELGRRIEVEMLSWNYVTLITTGVKNDTNPEAAKLIRTSYDGVNIKGGEGSVASYVQRLKAEGYANASAKLYIEIYCFLRRYIKTDAKGQSTAIEIPEDEQTIHQISLSPQSAGQWNGHLTNLAVRANRAKAKGTEGTEADIEVLVCEGEKKVLGANTFGLVKFSRKW